MHAYLVSILACYAGVFVTCKTALTIAIAPFSRYWFIPRGIEYDVTVQGFTAWPQAGV